MSFIQSSHNYAKPPSGGFGVVGIVFLASFALLALQITNARILSATLSHHYAFAVLSLAMLGLGLGGIITHNVNAILVNKQSKNHIILYGVLTVIAVPVSVWTLIVLNNLDTQVQVYWYWLAVLIPLVFGGALFAEIYGNYAQDANNIYTIDLIGAAMGGAGAVIILNMAGGLGATLLVGFVLGVGVLIYLGGLHKPQQPKLVMPIVLALILINLAAGIYMSNASNSNKIFTNNNPNKEIVDAIHGAWHGSVADSIWNAFGRTQLIEYQDNPDHKDIYIDGTAGTPMYQFTGDFNKPGNAVNDLLDFFPGNIPFKLIKPENKDNALIIGPGGGRDILLAANAGFKNVTGVEVNPSLLKLMDEYKQYNGGLYSDFNNITVHNAEGRHFVKRSTDNYDLIMLSLPVTNTSRSREGFALTESYLLTQQAINDYYQRLTDQGQLLIITHDELEVLRLVRVMLDAMQDNGIDTANAMQHLYVLGSFPYPIVVLSKTPFETDITRSLIQQVQQNDFSIGASYIPHLLQPGAGNPMLQALAQGNTDISAVEGYIQDLGHTIAAVTDDKPFFYNRDLGLPPSILLMLKLASIVALVALSYPLLIGIKSTYRSRFLRKPLIFALLGMGFMLIEITLVQRLTFFLGEPIIAMAVLLAAILIYMGIGSYVSSRLLTLGHKNIIMIAAAAIAVLCMVYSAVLTDLLNNLIFLNLSVRILIALLICLPLGLLLGVPFPVTIKLMHADNTQWAVPWMWAINGVFSVLGAVGAVALAMLFGMTAVMFIAGVVYALLLVVATSLRFNA